MVGTWGGDAMHLIAGPSLVLGYHFGDIDGCDTAFNTAAKIVGRLLTEPNQAMESVQKWCLGSLAHFACLLGNGTQMGHLLGQCTGDNWAAIDAAADFSCPGEGMPWFAPRGKMGSTDDPQRVWAMDVACWSTKLSLALCLGESAVSKQEMESIPTPKQMVQWAMPGPSSMAPDCAPFFIMFSPHLVAALASEKYNLDDQALGFVAAIHNLDARKGGDPKATPHILASCIKGRIMARRGQLQAAGAVFEAAAARAEEQEWWLLAALAFKDLKLLVWDTIGHSDHASRVLGAALRRLTGSAPSLSKLLDGLDASELMLMGVPEPGYEVVYSADSSDDGRLSSLRKELGELRLMALQKRATGAGVSDEALESAMESPDPKAALTDLLLARNTSAEGSEDVAQEALRDELKGLTLMSLQKRVAIAGITGDELEDAMEADDPKAATIQLLLAHEAARSTNAPDRAELESELAKLKVKALKKRARAAGVDEERLEDSDDADNPKAIVIALIVEAELRSESSAGDRPHFGSGKQQAQRSKPKPASRKGLLPANKHAMISYQWDDQDRVIAARETLVRLGVPCWMDIDGGMQQDIYESMAEGVENAACVVCFLSQKYQSSENCKLELKFAKQSGVPIVPVMVESTQGWRPSGWLGIVVAGALWTSLRDDSEFESSVRGLVGQIKGAVPGSGDGVLSDDDDHEEEGEAGADAGAELRAELARLRKATDAKAVVKDVFTFDRDAPAEVFAGVPELPEDFRPTEKISTLRQNLLHSTTPTKIGFWGMGGIGKTVTGAALVRDADVRDHFDQIVWLPLGQTPVMEKLQSSALEQLCGKQMEPNLSEDERHDALREAFKGKRVLLALDDLWEEAHAPQLNFVDASCGSRVLISTRIRHLLSDAFSVEIGKPSVDDSISILMAAAELGDTGDAPAEAAEIVELCGRLPLALVMTGKLVLDLDVGSKWDGVTSILRDELRGDEQVASREQAVIRASLAGLKGSERDTTGGRQLFKLFGLVPEDTSCPLECLQMMYDAVYEPQRPTSVLHIRKWLKILIDRSLVLGTVDRASLHDLVLDFTISMHSKAELAAAHRRVVEAFRSNRPLTAAGISMWDSVNRDDPVTAYVLDDSVHHVRSSCDSSDPLSDEVLLGWLTDQPQDTLHQNVVVVLGTVLLAQAAESASAAGDPWQAACRWACVAQVEQEFRGQAAAVGPIQHAADALTKVDLGPRPSSLSVFQKDLLELAVVDLLAVLDLSLIASMLPRMNRVLASSAAKARPTNTYGLIMRSTYVIEWWSDDPQRLARASADAATFLVRTGCEENPDPAVREYCCVELCYVNTWSLEISLLSPTFTWDLFGPEGEHCRKGMSVPQANQVFMNTSDRALVFSQRVLRL